jgi:hypothetical protein
MSHRKLMKIALAACLSGLAVVGAGASTAVAQETQTLEVAEIGSRYILDLAEGQTLPLRGTTFITEGYLYEEGTLTCSEGACDGVVYDAEGVPSPEFPDAVVGMWTCYGTTLEEGAVTSGPNVASTQLYELGETPGADTVVSTGVELADVGVPIQRAITGGTGEHAGANGVQTQTVLGFNNAETMVGDKPVVGVVLSVELVTG